MENFLNFIINHYLWFLIISIMLILALIGYFVDIKRGRITYKINKNEEEINLDALNSLNNQEGVSLQSMLDKNKTINAANNPESL